MDKISQIEKTQQDHGNWLQKIFLALLGDEKLGIRGMKQDIEEIKQDIATSNTNFEGRIKKLEKKEEKRKRFIYVFIGATGGAGTVFGATFKTAIIKLLAFLGSFFLTVIALSYIYILFL